MIELALMFCMTSHGVAQCHREVMPAVSFKTVAECISDLNSRVLPDLKRIGVEVVAATCADPAKDGDDKLKPRTNI